MHLCHGYIHCAALHVSGAMVFLLSAFPGTIVNGLGSVWENPIKGASKGPSPVGVSDIETSEAAQTTMEISDDRAVSEFKRVNH